MPVTLAPEKNVSQPRTASARWWQAAALVIMAAGYLILFLASDTKRMLVLSLSLLPDQIVYSWYDGDVDRLAVLDRLPVLAAATAILLVAYLAGRLVIERVGADRQISLLEMIVFATGIGLNLVSLLTLAVGLVGGLQLRIVFLGGAAAIVAASAWRWRTTAGTRLSVPRKQLPSHTFLERTAMSMCIPFVVVIIAGALLPPWHFDTREYHAQVPKQWYQQGAVTFLPHNVYGNMPLGAEMHSIVGMNLMPGPQNWWWGVLVGKTVSAVYAPLTALALIGFGRRFLLPAAGAIAAFVFISTPWITHVSTSGLIDGASAFYLFATFYALMIWYAQRKPGESAAPALLMSGLLAGSAVACKYPAVLFVVLPGMIAAACLPLGKLHLRQAMTFTLAVVVACGLWFGKNLVLAKNPTYPLLYRVFDGKTRTAEKDEQWTAAHGPPQDAHGRSYTWNFLRDSATLLLWRSEFASPLLLPLAAIGFFSRRHSKLVLAIAVLIAFNVLAWWFLTHRIDRFLVPILPLVALLGAVGATCYGDRLWQRAIVTILCLGFAFNLVYATSPLPGDNRFLTSYASIRRDMPTDGPFSAERMHRAHKFLNANVQPGFAVLAVGEAQVFDFEMPVFYNTCFDDCIFETMMKGRTSEQRINALRDRRISHLFIFWYELDRYRSGGNYGYSDYVTPELIQREFVEPGILREIPLGLDRANSQVFEVVGWRNSQS